ncbi:MAG: TIGR02647 family protein [Gammaproteobacteria bacterium]|uniref:TIGR02647 family protein n=1 Tax=Pseudomaricurvus alcaniphilus TaxID=1166482 RepID=UPI001408D724|nr:TIGR02647 family protein [Pseudomaricurvus alcaniphilus]MBR9913071.1 TIGR02647 family protein [Gammaproteobacteria bacterium]NHN36109.1 TIGR02647 family protein [Pseudomaricurvus alcaniphilus]
MPYTLETMEEIKLLNQFKLDSTQSGIKVHAHQAPPATVAAAARLFDKGLTDHVDGGYLTERGLVAANHAQILMGLLAQD